MRDDESTFLGCLRDALAAAHIDGDVQVLPRSHIVNDSATEVVIEVLKVVLPVVGSAVGPILKDAVAAYWRDRKKAPPPSQILDKDGKPYNT